MRIDEGLIFKPDPTNRELLIGNLVKSEPPSEIKLHGEIVPGKEYVFEDTEKGIVGVRVILANLKLSVNPEDLEKIEKMLRQKAAGYRVEVSVVKEGKLYLEVKSIGFDHIDEANANVIGALRSICNAYSINWEIPESTFLSKSFVDAIFSGSFPEILAKLSPEVKDATVLEGSLHAWDLQGEAGSQNFGLMIRKEYFDEETLIQKVKELGFRVDVARVEDKDVILIQGSYNKNNKRKSIGTFLIALEAALKKER